jgi:hypothetical protein
MASPLCRIAARAIGGANAQRLLTIAAHKIAEPNRFAGPPGISSSSAIHDVALKSPRLDHDNGLTS